MTSTAGPENVLPTELQVYQHFLHLEQVKMKSGEWTNYTPLTSKARSVAMSISSQWDKTNVKRSPAIYATDNRGTTIHLADGPGHTKFNYKCNI